MFTSSRIKSVQFFFIPSHQTFFFLLCSMVLLWNCRQKNTLAQDEASIISELANMEALEGDRPQETKKGSYLNIPEEPRNPDPANPPIVLDILKARADIRNMHTSDLFSEIRYIPINFQEPDDATTSKFGEYNFLVTRNNIIASHFTFGIAQFDLYGNFINQIVKNDFYFTAVPNHNSVMITGDDRNQFVGCSGEVHAIGDMIFYQFHDNPDGHGAMMQYDTNPESLSPMTVHLDENPMDAPKGIELFSFDIHNPKIGAMSSIRPSNLIPINEEEWAASSSVMNSSKYGHFLYTTNTQGDTLTKFKDHDPVVNFNGGAYRSTDSGGDQYNYQGQQHIRQAHNDTIYILAQSNKLIPKYVLDFGEKGIQSALEGVDPKISLKEKFLIHEFTESKDYLFIIYTQNVPSPNSAKKKEVFYNACIYDKKTRELFHIYKDEPPFIPEGRSWPKPPQNYLTNNLDDGPDFWPKKTTQDGRPFTWIKQDRAKGQADYLLMIGY